MKAKSVPEKIGIKENMRSIFVNAPVDTLKDVDSPLIDLKAKLTGKFDYIHLFVKSQAEFLVKFPKMTKHLKQTGMLWLSWPKSRQEETDLDIKIVINLGYDFGLVESKCISINSIWSALKFSWPKENKRYTNSYGKLK